MLVWKLDRFGRSALDVLANIRDLDAAGVRFIATTQGIDTRPGGAAASAGLPFAPPAGDDAFASAPAGETWAPTASSS